jgi:arylsulfatase A-like enzyme
VLLDAARADRFSTYGYARETTPNVDRLAARSAVFLRHHTQGPNTLTSLPALLTSRYFAAPLFPHTASVPVARPGDLFRWPDGESISLPRAFAGAGYRTVAISGHTWTRAGTAFAAEFDELRDVPALVPYDHRRGYPTAAQVVDQAIDWIAAHRTAPFFMYLHLMDTHFPHPFEEDAQALFGSAAYDSRAFDERGRPRASSQPLTGDDRRYLDALYDGGLRFADRHLGRLVAFLADAGLLDGAVVAVTSDHGEELLEAPGRIGHAGDRLYEALLHIPLVVFAPRAVPATRVDAFSEAVDVMPTLLDAAGVALPAGRRTDGRSLLPVARGAEPGATFTFSALHVAWANQRMLFPDPRPLLADQEELAAVELYDLAADPLERHDLAAARPDDRRRLATALFAHGDYLSGAWNLRWVGDGSRRRFEGRIRTDGIVRSVVPLFTESGRYRVDGTSILFADPGREGESGFSFTTVPREAPVTFELLIDGRPAAQAVLLGGAAVRPHAMPFTLEGTPHSEAAYDRPPDPPRPLARFLLYRNRLGTPEEPVTLDQETRERLRSLGYIQ